MDMTEDEHQRLLDLIYDAAIAPERWEQAIEGLADAVGGNSGWLSSINAADGSGEGLVARVDPLMPTLYQDYFGSISPFANHPNPQAYVARWRPIIKTDSYFLPKEELVKSEYYNDFMAPQQVHSVLVLGLASEGLNTQAINLHRSVGQSLFGAREFETMRAFHPHVIRAYRMSRVFSGMGAQVRAMQAAMDASPHALFVVDGAGQVQRMNRRAEQMAGRADGLTVVAGRLTASHVDAARSLQALVGKAGDPAQRRGGGMALLTAHSWTPVSITVTPIRAERWPVENGRPSVLVCATDPTAEVDVPDQTLRDLFALTGAEIRVVRALLGGRTPRQAATAFGVSVTTVRTQMARVFEKTGASGQAELSRLITRIAGAQMLQS